MAKRSATAKWNGGLRDGSGRMELGSGAFSGPFSFNTRMGDEPGTNPEELIGAALAGCFSMALAATLEKDGTPAESLETGAAVDFGPDDGGFTIRSIELTVKAKIDGIDEEKFVRTAEAVKSQCPVGKALAAVPIDVKASLVN